MPGREKLADFTAWCAKHITGDETFRSGTAAQIFLDRLFQAFGQAVHGIPDVLADFRLIWVTAK